MEATCLLQGDVRVLAKGEFLLRAVEAVLVAPEFPSGRLDQ